MNSIWKILYGCPDGFLSC